MMPKFITKEQIPEFVTAIKGRKEIPLKFVYLEEGAHNWDELVKDEKYGIGKAEIELIKTNISKILKFLKNGKFNMIDVGCGNGEKSEIFINKLSGSHKPVNYVAIDISREMLKMAIENIKRNKNINTQTYCIDFERGNFAQITDTLRKVYYRNNFLLFLGNTMGNSSDMSRLLTNIRESMISSDLLLIGCATGKGNYKSVLEHYDNNLVHKAAFFGLAKTGAKPKDGRFLTVYNKKKSRIEVYFVFGKDIKLKLDGENVKVKKGDKILIVISYRVTKDFIKTLLDRLGFKVLLFTRSKNKENALVLCKPKPIGE